MELLLRAELARRACAASDFSVLLTQTRYGTRSLRHAKEFLAENGLAHCRETIPYKEAMRLAPDEGRFPSASGYGLIAKELSDAFNA